MKVGGFAGRPPIHTIFKNTARPTGYTKGNLVTSSVNSAFHLVIDKMLEHIKYCTEEGTFQTLNSDWTAAIRTFTQLQICTDF